VSRHLPPAPEELHARWAPPGTRKNTPSPAVPTEIRKDKRQLSLWASSPAGDGDVAAASAEPAAD
jgi:hypothetical protein